MGSPTWGGGGSGASPLTVPASMIFASDSARDTYFTANPSFLSQGLFCSSNGVLEQYVGSSWVNMGIAIQGAQGVQGTQGIQGIQGVQGLQGVAGQGVTVQYSPDGVSSWTSTLNTSVHYFWRWSIDGGTTWSTPVRFQITASSINTASSTVLGVVKVGNGLAVDGAGNVTLNNATNSVLGGVQLTGDLGGNAASPIVAKINGVTMPANTPSNNQVLLATSGNTSTWSTLPTTTVATTSVAGTVIPDGTVITVSAGGNITVAAASATNAGVAKIDNSTIKMVGGALTTTTASNSQLGVVKSDNVSTIIDGTGVISVPQASSTVAGVAKVDNTTIKVNNGAISVQAATSTQLGAVSPDGNVITNTNGNITVPIATTAKVGVVQVDGVTLAVDASGKISSKIGAAVYTIAATQTAMLALYASPQTNLVICTRTDINHIYYLNAGASPTVLANWIDGGSTVGNVQSFNTRNGAIVPVAGDYNAYIAPFNKVNIYNPNECVIYNSVAYYCTATTTANANWNASQWATIVPSASSTVSGVVQLATTTPSMNGAAASGSLGTVSDAGHIHPTDTTRAPLASPAFTGTPTAPTATLGTNTTQLATTAFVAAAVPVVTTSTPLINGTATIGSSGKWADGAHVHPTDTTRAPLASPAFTGSPTAPTQSQNDNSTNIATTAYADRAAKVTFTGGAAVTLTNVSITASSKNASCNSTTGLQVGMKFSDGTTTQTVTAVTNSTSFTVDVGAGGTTISLSSVIASTAASAGIVPAPTAGQTAAGNVLTATGWGSIPTSAIPIAQVGTAGIVIPDPNCMTVGMGTGQLAVTGFNNVSVSNQPSVAGQVLLSVNSTSAQWGAIPVSSSSTAGILKVGGVAPSPLGTAAAGSSIIAAAADHIHALPSNATTSASGLMAATDKAALNAIGATFKLYAPSDNFQTIVPATVTIVNLTGAASFNNSTYFTANGDGGIKVNQACVVSISANLTMDTGSIAANTASLETRRTLILTAGSVTLGSNVCYMPKSQTDLSGSSFTTTHVLNANDVIYLKAWQNMGANINCRVLVGFGCDLSVTILKLGTTT